MSFSNHHTDTKLNVSSFHDAVAVIDAGEIQPISASSSSALLDWQALEIAANTVFNEVYVLLHITTSVTLEEGMSILTNWNRLGLSRAQQDVGFQFQVVLVQNRKHYERLVTEYTPHATHWFAASDVALQDVQQLRSDSDVVCAVPVATVITTRQQEFVPYTYSSSVFRANDNDSEASLPTRDFVVLGGTFDHMHAAHRVMLTLALLRTNKDLAIGLTTDAMLSRKANAGVLESYKQREHRLLTFCALMNGRSVGVQVYPLSDNYGCALLPNRELLICSEEKKVFDTAPLVNVERQKLGLKPVDIFAAPLLLTAQESESKEDNRVSSTSVRASLVETQGDALVRCMRKLWNENCAAIGLENGSQTIEKWFDVLLTHYHQESQRAYHTFRHIAEMMSLLDFHRGAAGEDYELLRMATWFHDIIYQPMSKNNEEESAEQWVLFASETSQQHNLSSDDVEFVRVCIIATKLHDVPETLESTKQESCALFLDIDMNILASRPVRYIEYAEQIHTEYKVVEQYARKRIAVLNTFLEKSKLFHSKLFDVDYFNALARYNIHSEIKLLSSLE